jgi:hypothetical protein
LVKKCRLDTDEFDKETRNAVEDIVKQEIAKDWTYEELQRRYENLKTVTLKNFPSLWKGLNYQLKLHSWPYKTKGQRSELD